MLIRPSDIQMFTNNGGDPTLGAQELKAIADAESSPHLSHRLTSLVVVLEITLQSSSFIPPQPFRMAKVHSPPDSFQEGT